MKIVLILFAVLGGLIYLNGGISLGPSRAPDTKNSSAEHVAQFPSGVSKKALDEYYSNLR